MHAGIFLALSGDQLFGLIIFGVVVINVIRAILKAQKEQREQEKERFRQPPPSRTQPGEKRADREIEDFLEEISRGKGAPAPTPPRPAEQPQQRPQPPLSQPPQRPVPPIAHPVPPTMPRPIERPPQQPRPQPVTMRQPPPQRPPEPPRERPRTIAAAPAPTSHPAGYKVATAPAPGAPPLQKKREYALEVAESLEVTHAEKAESSARFDELLPEDPLQKAIILTELLGPCRARRGARNAGRGLRV